MFWLLLLLAYLLGSLSFAVLLSRLFGTRDPITRGGERAWQEQVPGARGQPHARLRGEHIGGDNHGIR